MGHFLKYCDKVADSVINALRQDTFFINVTGMRFDLNPDGSFKSTKKTIYVTDQYGSRYKVTIEENSDHE